MTVSTRDSINGSASLSAGTVKRLAEASDFLMGWRRTGFGLLLMVAALGCSSPVTQANYEKIKNGMTLSEVETIFGRPGKSYQGMKTWSNGPDKTITVIFDDRGMVVDKSREGL